jgi:hypothetical protein
MGSDWLYSILSLSLSALARNDHIDLPAAAAGSRLRGGTPADEADTVDDAADDQGDGQVRKRFACNIEGCAEAADH